MTSILEYDKWDDTPSMINLIEIIYKTFDGIKRGRRERQPKTVQGYT